MAEPLLGIPSEMVRGAVADDAFSITFWLLRRVSWILSLALLCANRLTVDKRLKAIIRFFFMLMIIFFAKLGVVESLFVTFFAVVVINFGE